MPSARVRYQEPRFQTGDLGTSRDGLIYDDEHLLGHKRWVKVEWQIMNNPSERKKADGKVQENRRRKDELEV